MCVPLAQSWFHHLMLESRQMTIAVFVHNKTNLSSNIHVAYIPTNDFRFVIVPRDSSPPENEKAGRDNPPVPRKSSDFSFVSLENLPTSSLVGVVLKYK